MKAPDRKYIISFWKYKFNFKLIFFYLDPLLDIVPKKVSNTKIKFQLYNGSSPALIKIKIVGKSETGRYRTSFIEIVS